MIEFTKSYKTSSGKIVGTIQEAQALELAEVLTKVNDAELVSKIILDNKDLIIDILTTTPNSKPKARSLHGGTKKRKTVITDAVASVTSTNNT